jgi:hypothetical protein
MKIQWIREVGQTGSHCSQDVGSCARGKCDRGFFDKLSDYWQEGLCHMEWFKSSWSKLIGYQNLRPNVHFSCLLGICCKEIVIYVHKLFMYVLFLLGTNAPAFMVKIIYVFLPFIFLSLIYTRLILIGRLNQEWWNGKQEINAQFWFRNLKGRENL